MTSSRTPLSPAKVEELDPVVLPEYILCPTATGTTVRCLLFHLHKAGTSSATLPLRLMIVEGEHSGAVYGKMTQLKDQLGFVGTAWMKIFFERNLTMCLEDARTRLQMNPNLLLPLAKNVAKPLPSGLDPGRLLVDPKDFTVNPIDRLSPEDLTAFLARIEPFLDKRPLRKKDVFTSIVGGPRKRYQRQFFSQGEVPEGEEEEEGVRETPSTPSSEKKERPKPTPTPPREREEVKSGHKRVKDEVKLSPKVPSLTPRRLLYPSAKSPLGSTRCGVCWSENADSLIQCTKCMYLVHASCYGNPLIRLSEDEQVGWVCESCRTGDNELECVLCLNKGGLPLKRTVDSRWCHMMCAYYTPQVSFVFPVGREPIQNRLVRHSKCFFCLKANGACVSCHTCNKNFHLPCVLRKHNPFVKQTAAPAKPEMSGKMLLNDSMIVFNCGTH